MKKREKYYPVNSQEDEDGFSQNPEMALIHKNEKGKKQRGTHNTISNKQTVSMNLEFSPFISLLSEMPDSIPKK